MPGLIEARPLRAALLFAATLLAVPAVADDAPGHDDMLTEAELVRAVLSHDVAEAARSLAAARSEAGARARASAPRLALHALHEESTGRDTAFTTQSAGVSVAWELARRNRWARDAGAAERLEAGALLEADLTGLACETREIALAAWVARREAALREGTGEELAQLAAAMQRLVEAGEQSQHDLDRVRAELAWRRSDALLARAEALSLEGSLAHLAGRDPAGLALSDEGLAASADAVVSLGLDASPELRALSRRLEVRRAESEIARREAPAELEMRAAYRSDDAPDAERGDGYEMEVAVGLPSPSLRRSAHARARAEEIASESALARARLDAELAIRAAHSRWISLQESAAAEPAPPSLVEGARKRYLAGEGSMTEILDTLAAVEELALSRLRVEAARRLARVDLDCATGLATAPALRALVQERLP